MIEFLLGFLLFLSIAYALAIIIGTVYGGIECEGKDFLDLRDIAFDMPLKKILFTFAVGLHIGYWLFGHAGKQKANNNELRENLRSFDKVQKENKELKEELSQVSAELYLLTDYESEKVRQ